MRWSPGELLDQDMLGYGEHLVDTRNDWVVCGAFILEGWHEGLSKLSILHFFTVIMVHASPTDRFDIFSQQRHKEGLYTQLQNHETLGISESGAQTRDSLPLGKFYREKIVFTKKVLGFKVPLV